MRHASRTLAPVETAAPYELTRDLDTVGAYDFGGKLDTAVTAHPRVCPDTGEMRFFGYGMLEAPYLTYRRADASGDLVISRPVELPRPTMMHDFNVTAEHVVFMDLSVVFDRDLAMAGTMPYHWDDGYGARQGVLRRNDPYGEVRWFGIDPCYVFHPLNACDAPDGTIVLHVMRYPELWRRTGDVIDRRQEAVLWKWTIDAATGTVREEQCDDRPGTSPGR
ncbi:carotenoid oxygenase family protein [Streptomyces sp. NPDC005141]